MAVSSETRKAARRALPGFDSVAELAEACGVRECLAWFTREKQWINEQHLALSRVAAPTFFEAKRAEWFVSQLGDLGWFCRLDKAGNVIAELEPNRDGPYVALTAHLDTVLAPRSGEEIRVGPDGRFLGPGVSDNGAGLAALVAVARALREAPLPGSLSALPLLVANVCEEGEGNLSGMRYLCEKSPLGPKIRSFVVLDGPSTDHFTCRALASRRFEVLFTGPGGHSWSDYGIGNPVHALSRAIATFTEEMMAASVPGDPPSASFNFGLIEGGVSVNSIPAEARAKLDIRSESVERLETMVELLNSSVEQARDAENSWAAGGRVTAKIRESGSRPAGRLAADAPILNYVRAVDSHLAIRSKADCASTDANIPLSMGLPAISIGAGGQGGGAHTPGEWFHPEGRDLGLKRILLLLCLLMAE